MTNLRIDIAHFQLSIHLNMLLTFTLIVRVAFCYFRAVDLSDYELGLTDFETYYMISNVNSLYNNKFYFDEENKEIVILEGSYEIRNINKYLKCAILQFYPNDVARKKTLCKEDE